MKRILLAFQFLTIIPFGNAGKVSEREMGGATAFFPLVGFVEGMIYILLASLFLKAFPSDLTNGLLIFAMIFLNGGLHMDGLSDTFDALASRGDREKKLAIMKEGTVGPTGVVAIVLVILLKYLLLNAVFFHSSLRSFFVTLILVPVLSRWAMVPAIYHCRSVRQDGLGKVFIEHTGVKEMISSTVLALILCVAGVFALCSGNRCQLMSELHLFIILPLLYVFGLSSVWFFKKHFDGMTGDSFGTVHETATLLVLIIRVIWSQQYF
ncbi:MAG: adenosylcobinamide-GDP ribazoletransferase [Nitrospiraceae bacterium]|nr:MAG: adenosylcobinamide-GDP ribazoletransferase [Nitrospiraceae bacterium]